MPSALWSSKLAEQAQEWSNGCFYAHPDKRVHADYQGIGQNLFISWLDEGGDNPPVVTLPVDMWNSEVANFSYPVNTCRKGAVCGHYTQVVWAETTKVGCGIKFCRWARSSKRTFENAWLVTCNYSLPETCKVKNLTREEILVLLVQRDSAETTYAPNARLGRKDVVNMALAHLLYLS
ncbi:hypothetical protein BSL78_13493 [Apostichopus japonicus]|uniref:SCP domain-containing protein n=1 Tax=Stichopus japonicus TaxID=307972 RepID=A0A2G8KNP6_STIJA|nr:hypothetical protein BSL78_13493 [Apostichopus japonicus]